MDSCHLNMPEGLKELMSDISREVLRSQPEDIYEFIADYLSALLVTRDNLSIARQVCNNLCDCVCHPELVQELIKIGVDKIDAKKAQDVIMDHINRENVNEGNLMAALVAKTNIKASMFPAIVAAVRIAYIRHQAHSAHAYEPSLDGSKDDIARAASHTLKLYQESGPPEEIYGEMATKIQTSYRAYGVRRSVPSNIQYTYRDIPIIASNTDVEEAVSSQASSWSEEVHKEYELTNSMHEKRFNTASSISLAGSYYGLPKRTPYNVHDVDCMSLLEETDTETSNNNDNETLTTANFKNKQDKTKRISFGNDSEAEIFHLARPKEKSHSVSNDDVEVIDEFSADDDEEILRVEDQFYDKHSTKSAESVDYDKADDNDYDHTAVKNVDINYINILSKEIESDSNDDADTP